ncbi:MAG TPA: aspartate-semialdehyde dehydrogenase [Anaerolineae bacterium]|nr:aspartate-semialdehyde dehydrogenase [Anaerolineae bacterium]
MERIPVIILGATGAVGQRFVQLLENHPWFDVVGLTGSDRSIGRRYSEACRWVLTEPMPDYAQAIIVTPTEPDAAVGGDSSRRPDSSRRQSASGDASYHRRRVLAFSALPADSAREVEPAFAAAGYGVCSNASAFRMAPDVPLLIPEVNPDHTRLIEAQRALRGWPGFITTNPNCTATGLVMALKPLHMAFGVRRVMAVSLQALSGAGYPGVASLDILDNVIPYVGGEEDKVEAEPRKMLGQIEGDSIRFADFYLSAHTNRVAVSDGHTVCASVEFGREVSVEDVEQALTDFRAPDPIPSLPSAPARTLLVRREPDRPQPRRDRNEGRGMTAVVGRVRPCPLFGIKFVVLSHNTIRGAAGGSLLNAELLVAQGYLD